VNRKRGETYEERHKRDGKKETEGNRLRGRDRVERWRGTDRGEQT
jgi:hypothetical protein